MATGSIGKGSSAEYYTDKGGDHSTLYYVGGKSHSGGGTWVGAGAAAAGLAGVIEANIWKELIDKGKDPFAANFGEVGAAFFGQRPSVTAAVGVVVAEKVLSSLVQLTPEQVAVLRMDAAREAVSTKLFDLTFSPEKSVSLTWFIAQRAANDAAAGGDAVAAARWQQRAAATDAAVLSGAAAHLEFMEAYAGYTRVGSHAADSSAGRWLDGHAFIGGRFYERVGKSGDPQLHAHHPISPRVVDTSGKAHALDGSLIYASNRAAAALGSLVMYTQMSQSLWATHWVPRADGHGWEVEGVSEADQDLFSDRSRIIGIKERELLASFQARTGRIPTPADVGRIKSLATVVTRGRGIDKETQEQMLDRVAEKADADNLGGLRRMAADLDAVRLPPEVSRFHEEDLITSAIALAQADKQVFTAMDLYEHVAKGMGPVQDTSDWKVLDARVWAVVEKALARSDVRQIGNRDLAVATPLRLQRANGESSYLAPARTATGYATQGMMDAEAALLRDSKITDRERVSTAEARRWISDHVPLLEETSRGQYEALFGLLTSGGAQNNLVGLAGAGKSYVLARFSEAWPDLTGGRVIGVATAEKAVQSLIDEGVPEAVNIATFLLAHDLLDRELQRPVGVNIVNTHDMALRLSANDVLMIDEAGTVGTATARRLQDIVNQAGGRVIAAGDPAQSTSVEAGGWFDLLVERSAHTYTLREVRRFQAGWEGAASSRMRDGDRSVAMEYDRHNRLIGVDTRSDTIREAAVRYVDATVLGHTAIVPVASNEMAAQVSAAIRDEYLSRGLLNDEGTVILGRDQNVAGVGDKVMTRLNDKKIGVTNRVSYILNERKANGDIVLANERTGELVNVPAVYVANHTQLAYAATVHAAQGLTVDVCITLPEGMSPNTAYPAMTRGRQYNIAILSRKNENAMGRIDDDRPDRDIVTLFGDIISAPPADVSATQQSERNDAILKEPETVHHRLEDLMLHGDRARMNTWLDRLEHEGLLSNVDRQKFDNGGSSDTLARQLRVLEQAGRSPEETLREAVTSRGFDKVRDVGAATLARINRDLDGGPPPPDVNYPRVPADLPADFRRAVAQAHELADEIRQELGDAAAVDESSWVRERIGPTPEDAIERLEWVDRAGRMVAWERIAGRVDKIDKLGPTPGILNPEARAAWHDAHLAAGSPPTLAQERELTDGQLRVRVAAWDRAMASAPDHVDGALKVAEAEVMRLRHDQAEAINHGDDRAAWELEMAELEMRVAVNMWNEAAEARDAWIEDWSYTQEVAKRAQQEMKIRGLDHAVEPMVTSQEWMDAELASRARDADRQVLGEHDVIEEVIEDEPFIDATGEKPGGYQEQLDVRDHQHRAIGDDIDVDDLDAARSLQAARAAASESGYLRAQEAALDAGDAEWRHEESALAAHRQTIPLSHDEKMSVAVASSH